MYVTEEEQKSIEQLAEAKGFHDLRTVLERAIRELDSNRNIQPDRLPAGEIEVEVKARWEAQKKMLKLLDVLSVIEKGGIIKEEKNLDDEFVM